MDIKYSIVIPTYDHIRDYLIPCVNSILEYTDMINVEIIIVANGCNPAHYEDLSNMSKHSNISCFWYPEGLGYTKATNVGMRVARGEFIILLNDDTILLQQPKNQWIDILEQPFKDHKNTGISGPVKFTWDCNGIKRDAIAFWCCMFKRTLAEEIDFLDEIFNPGMGEDGDFSVKAELRGYTLVQVPNNLTNIFGTPLEDFSFPIWHKGNGTFAYNTDIKNEIINRNIKILNERYGPQQKEEITSIDKIYDICLNHTCDINELFPTLKKYASECTHITEFGVRGVFSTYAFLAARPKTMRSYDVYTSPNILEAYDVSKTEGIDFSFIEQDVLQTSIEETDLLFIDTLHTYAQLSSELKLHSPKVKKYILMHDTETCKTQGENNQEGLQRAIDEFLLQNPDWNIKEHITISNGLTILERKNMIQSNPIKFSIVIPTYNHLEDALKPCLDAVLKYTYLTDKEIIIIANGCTDGTNEFLSTLSIQNVRIPTPWKDPIGPIKAYNEAVKIARGDYIILLDNDSFLLPQPADYWVNLLYAPFVEDDKVAISGPFANNYKDLGLMIHGGCAMYRKDVWNLVGGYDEAFGYGFLSDPDICMRVIKKGYKCVGVPENKEPSFNNGMFQLLFPVFHSNITTTMHRPERREILRRNRDLLYERHGKKPLISIVIPTYNHLDDLLKPCIESLIQHTDLSNVEVIISANGCVDGTEDFVDNLGYPFRLIWNKEPLGYTKATNLGIQAARGEYIILLNNDVIFLDKGFPKNKWIEMLMAPFFADKRTGITGPLELYDDYAGDDVMIFFCVMIKREVFNAIGLLDEVFSPGGGEDIDFCVKLKQAGFTQVVVPEKHHDFTFTNEGYFPIYHLGEGTFSEKEIPEYGRSIIKRNGLINLKRHNKHIKLNIGSGGVKYKDYINVDLYDRRAHVVADITKLDEIFDENSVEEILASHVFEHLNPYHAIDILEKWRKVLKPGGKLILEMPDILEVCKAFPHVNKEERYGLLNVIYGAVNTTGEGGASNITSPHLFGWYPEILGDHLINSGYRNIVFMQEQIPHPGYNFRAECIK